MGTTLRPRRSHWTSHEDDNILAASSSNEGVESSDTPKGPSEEEKTARDGDENGNASDNIELTEIRQDPPPRATLEAARSSNPRRTIDERSTYYSTMTRTFVIVLIGAVLVLGGKAIDFSGAGTIAVIVMALVLGRLWKEHSHVIIKCRCCYGGRRGCIAFRSDEESSKKIPVFPPEPWPSRARYCRRGCRGR